MQNTSAPGGVLNHAPDVRSLFCSYRDLKLIFSTICIKGFPFPLTSYLSVELIFIPHCFMAACSAGISPYSDGE